MSIVFQNVGPGTEGVHDNERDAPFNSPVDGRW